jgi:methyl acetate hydrolase
VRFFRGCQMRHRNWLGAIALPVLFCSATASAAGNPIDDYLAARVRETRIPGIVAAIVDHDGVRYSAAFGRQDVANNLPMQRDAIFRIASMTKPITSLAVAMLVEEKLLGLDDPVEKYLPEYANPRVIDAFYPLDRSSVTRPAIRSITLRHLLTNTSGLGYPFSSLALSQLQGEGAAARELPEPQPLLHDPGAEWTYGPSTRVLGRVIEKVTGKPLDTVLRERIFEPLGMHETFFVVPGALRARVVTIHRWVDGRLVETPNGAEVAAPVAGDGGLHSTAADFARFIQCILNHGRAPDGRQLISDNAARSMGRVHTGSVRVRLQDASSPALSAVFPLGAGRDGFGLGFQITGANPPAGMRRPGSMSWAGIFNTQFWIDPEAGIGGILLMQYLPFYDKAAIETLQQFERLAYAAPGP